MFYLFQDFFSSGLISEQLGLVVSVSMWWFIYGFMSIYFRFLEFNPS